MKYFTREVGVTAPESTATARKKESSWVVIRLDFQVHGKIEADHAGRQFIELDLNQPRWKQFQELGFAIARTLEGAFKLNENRIELRLRMLQIGAENVQPEIHLISAFSCPDQIVLKNIVSRFGAELTHQGDCFDTIVSAALLPEHAREVEQGVQSFLQGHGGQSLQRNVQLMVNDEGLVSLRGHWRAGPEQQASLPVENEFEALYDGRRLRARTMFVTVVDERSRALEIYYDEEQFDHVLRELQEDKTALLALVVAESRLSKERVRFELRSLRRIPAPKYLQLTN